MSEDTGCFHHIAFAASGPLNPLEFADLRSSPEKMQSLVDATGGGIFRLAGGHLPEIRKVRPAHAAAGGRARDRPGGRGPQARAGQLSELTTESQRAQRKTAERRPTHLLSVLFLCALCDSVVRLFSSSGTTSHFVSTVTAITTGAVRSGPFTRLIFAIVSSRFGVMER